MVRTHATTRSAAKRQSPVPSAHALVWKRRLKELLTFKKKHGHCRASTFSKTDAGLGAWVRTRRGKRRKGDLRKEEIRQLDALGFEWGLSKAALQSRKKRRVPRLTKAERHQRKQAKWESMFEALVAYRQAHGHCQVPCRQRNRPAWAGGFPHSGTPKKREN